MHHGGRIPGKRGDVSNWGIKESHTEDIIDVRFGDADAENWKPSRMDKLLEDWEKTKKYKHG